MKKSILLLLALIHGYAIWANGITITDVSLENFNESENWVHIQCKVFWEGSWRIDSGPSNWDAAWVFAKYRANSGEWRHVTLSPTNSEIYGISADEYLIDVSSDNKGVFAYRASEDSGISSLSQIYLRLGWNLFSDNVDINDTIEVKVFAIEMVYVPEGSFRIGTNAGTEVDGFNAQLIQSENEITVNYGTSTTYAGDDIGLLPSSFPKGYQAFYCMKYEISEEQYVAFFNSLTAWEQSNAVDITGLPGKNSDVEIDGNTIEWLGVGNDATTTAPDRACGFLSSGMLSSYLSWAALRPMTELEFEKAARGPGTSVPEVYAWGTTSIISNPYTIVAQTINTDSEQTISFINTSEGRAAYNLSSTSYPRPARCGMFAHNSNLSATNTPRNAAGASYYGIMELSGNLEERVVSVGNGDNRAFEGEHGTGQPFSSYSFGSLLAGLRGGGWNSEASLLRISDRTYGGALPGILINRNNRGGRGVRTAE